MSHQGQDKKSPLVTVEQIDRMKTKGIQMFHMGLYPTALFWLDKYLSIMPPANYSSRPSSPDTHPESDLEIEPLLVMMAQCMYRLKQYHRTIAFITKEGMPPNHPALLFVLASCYADLKQQNEAFNIIQTYETYFLAPPPASANTTGMGVGSMEMVSSFGPLYDIWYKNHGDSPMLGSLSTSTPSNVKSDKEVSVTSEPVASTSSAPDVSLGKKVTPAKRKGKASPPKQQPVLSTGKGKKVPSSTQPSDPTPSTSSSSFTPDPLGRKMIPSKRGPKGKTTPPKPQEPMSAVKGKRSSFQSDPVPSTSSAPLCSNMSSHLASFSMPTTSPAATSTSGPSLLTPGMGSKKTSTPLLTRPQNGRTPPSKEGYDQEHEDMVIDKDQEDVEVWTSAFMLLKGRLYEQMDVRDQAALCYKASLKHSPYNWEALQALVQHQMLSASEEVDLLNQVQETLGAVDQLVPHMYQHMTKKYQEPLGSKYRSQGPGCWNVDKINRDGDLNGNDLMVTQMLPTLKDNPDLMTSEAERCFYDCDFQSCLRLTTRVLSVDPYHPSCLPVHISCLMELREVNQLFDLSHRLVDLYPEWCISWYSVGCYYLMINKTDTARRYLSKATLLDQVFGPAWMLYGHSFASESEHDQAMSAYFRASHLMAGNHLPLLYIGLEYSLSDNHKLADKFFRQARFIAPNDPFVLHEMGVSKYQQTDQTCGKTKGPCPASAIPGYEMAKRYMMKALTILEQKGQFPRMSEKWESLLNNLGHVHRKLGKFDQAIDYHKRALTLVPNNATTYTCMGFIHCLQKKHQLAIPLFHKALALKRDDPFASHMMTIAIEHTMNTYGTIITPRDMMRGVNLSSPACLPIDVIHENPLLGYPLPHHPLSQSSDPALSKPKVNYFSSVTSALMAIACQPNPNPIPPPIKHHFLMHERKPTQSRPVYSIPFCPQMSPHFSPVIQPQMRRMITPPSLPVPLVRPRGWNIQGNRQGGRGTIGRGAGRRLTFDT